MINIILGNVIALIASVLMVSSGLLKSKKKILYIQTTQISLSVISNIILGGITGAIINTLSCIRNILCYKNKLNKVRKIIIIILSTILSVCFNNLGIVGIFPLISTISYTWLIDIKDIKKFKILIIFTMIMWFIYDLYIMSYTSAIFDFLNIITNLISLFKLRKNKI